MSSRRALVADLIPISYVDGPGSRFVVFLQGCNFDCLACHNPQTISAKPCETTRWMEIDELIEAIRDVESFISGVTVSGGEATVQWPVVAELFGALAADPELAHLTRFVDSNGQATTQIWDALAPSMDAAMIDLKALDPEVHTFLTGRTNERVLESIELLAGLDKLHEVRLLIIPNVNDRSDHLAHTAERLMHIDPELRIRLIGFRHEGTREEAEAFTEATPETLRRAAGLLINHGVAPENVTIWPPL